MKILAINDVHIADRPPVGRVEGYREQIMSKLEECRRLVVREEIDITIFTGDLFHLKRGPLVSHRLIQQLIKLFGEWPGLKLAIVGNHDLGEEGIASVPRQPIGVLFEAGVLEWLQEDIVMTTPQLSLQFSPANYFDEIDYHPDNFTLERKDGVDYAIKVAHGMLTPPGVTFPFSYIDMSRVDIRGMDLVYFGHPHYDMGVETLTDVEDNVCSFVGAGSLSRVARTTENRTRQMRVIITELTKDDVTFSEHLLESALPADDVFHAQDIDGVEVTEPMQAFAQTLSKSIQLEDGDIGALIHAVSADVEPAVKAKVLDYLERAGL